MSSLFEALMFYQCWGWASNPKLAWQSFTLHCLPKKYAFVYKSIRVRECVHKKLSGFHGWIRIFSRDPTECKVWGGGGACYQNANRISHVLLPVNTRGHCCFWPLQSQADGDALLPYSSIYTLVLQPSQSSFCLGRGAYNDGDQENP